LLALTKRKPPHDHLLSRAAIALGHRPLDAGRDRPYRLHPLGFKKGETRAAAYLAINPMGKVPAIDHDGVIVTEAAAICCYLADAFAKPVSPCRSAIAVGARISNGCSSGRAV
jgi:glutathione S-transferase